MNINLLIKQIGSQKWSYYVTRKFNWYVEYIQILATKKKVQEKYIGFSCPTNNYLILNGDEYSLDTEAKNWNSYFEKYWSNDRGFFDKFSQKILNSVKEIVEYRDNLQKSDFSALSNSELAQVIIEFNEIYLKSFVPAWTRPDSYLEIKLKEKLQSQLSIHEDEVNIAFDIVATYPQLGQLDYSDEPLNLLKIALEVKKQNASLDDLPLHLKKLIDNHINQYSWLKGPVLYDNIAFKQKDYYERIIDILENKNPTNEILKIQQVRKNDAKSYLSLIKKYNIHGNLLKLCEATRNFMFLRTYTTEASDHLFFVARHTFFKEVARRLHLNLQDITMLNAKEIVLNLKNVNQDSIVQKIKERLMGFAIIMINGNVRIFFGPETLILQKAVSAKFQGNRSQVGTVKKINGRSASLGKVVGKVKILLNYKDAHKIERGEILVASMTTPDYIIAMERAAAFITDEGGVTCHAAIVAREFGVPCIVGTGNATKVLKDGDMVEVDAYEGVIRLL